MNVPRDMCKQAYSPLSKSMMSKSRCLTCICVQVSAISTPMGRQRGYGSSTLENRRNEQRSTRTSWSICSWIEDARPYLMQHVGRGRYNGDGEMAYELWVTLNLFRTRHYEAVHFPNPSTNQTMRFIAYSTYQISAKKVEWILHQRQDKRGVAGITQPFIEIGIVLTNKMQSRLRHAPGQWLWSRLGRRLG